MDRDEFPCCFLGHSQDMLPKGTDEARYRRRIGAILDQRFISRGVFSYITGLFSGIDQWSAEEIALQISLQYACLEGGITLHIVAGEDQQTGIERLKQIAYDVESITVAEMAGVSDEQRQRYIIDQSARMLVIHPSPLELPEVAYAQRRGIVPNFYFPAPIAKRAL